MVKREDVQLWSCVLTAMEAKARKPLPRSSYLEVIGPVLVYSVVPEYADMDRLSLQEMVLSCMYSFIQMKSYSLVGDLAMYLHCSIVLVLKYIV